MGSISQHRLVAACYGCGGRIIFHRDHAKTSVARPVSPSNTTNRNLCTIVALMPGAPAGVMEGEGGRAGLTINGACRRNELTMESVSDSRRVKRVPRCRARSPSQFNFVLSVFYSSARRKSISAERHLAAGAGRPMWWSRRACIRIYNVAHSSLAGLADYIRTSESISVRAVSLPPMHPHTVCMHAWTLL